MKTNWSTFNYNYAAVDPTLLSAIDFLTNGIVNRIICDSDRINCNILALYYTLSLGQIPFNVSYVSGHVIFRCKHDPLLNLDDQSAFVTVDYEWSSIIVIKNKIKK